MKVQIQICGSWSLWIQERDWISLRSWIQTHREWRENNSKNLIYILEFWWSRQQGNIFETTSILVNFKFLASKLNGREISSEIIMCMPFEMKRTISVSLSSEKREKSLKICHPTMVDALILLCRRGHSPGGTYSSPAPLPQASHRDTRRCWRNHRPPNAFYLGNI